ncbi:MAG: EAL domain-containing protein [Synechococcaceae cyanobacterium SM1_2_3]|nr:EAL domain-containing protein [Synechococcaceae cyanobacterium SM1_2_3]
MPRSPIGRSTHSFAVAMMIFLIAAATASAVIWRSEQNRIQIERARISDLAGDHAQAIQRHLERALSATYALAALVRQGNGVVSNFDAVAKEMLPFYPGASALELAPDGIIRHVAPLAENEKAIGLNLLQDPLQKSEAALTRNSGRLTLAGPLNLVQGGLGAVGRLPVFLDQKQGEAVFWGFAMVVLRFPDALDSARLAELTTRGFAYQLWRIEPNSGQQQIITASGSASPISPVERTLEAPNATWTLSVSPAQGWGDPQGLALKVALGLLFSLLAAYLAKLLAELQTHQQGLETLVAQRTQEIIAARHQLETTFAAIPDLVWLKDPNGVYLNCNPPFERFFGAKQAEIVGKTDYDFVARPLADSFREYDQKAIAAGQSQSNEEKLTFADNGYCGWFETIKTPMCDTEGNLIGVLGVARDITTRKQMDDALQKSQTLLNETGRIAHVGGWEFDIHTQEQIWTEEVYRIHELEYLNSPPTVSQCLDFYVPASRSIIERALECAIVHGEPFDLELEAITAKGHRRWIHAVGNVDQEQGKIIGVLQDITERKQAEEALRESQALNASVLDSLAEHIAVLDAQGVIIAVNRAWQRFADENGATPISSSSVGLNYLGVCKPTANTPNSAEAIPASDGIRAVLRGALDEFNLEYPCHSPDEQRWFNMHVTPLRGSRPGVVVTHENITQRKQAEIDQRIAAIAFEAQEGMIVTDAQGVILRVNRAFTETTGYSAEEAVGQTPRLLNSGRHDAAFYAAMWEAIHRTGTWQGEIWNRRCNGEVYPEWVTITAVKDNNGQTTHYVGTHTDITQRKATEDEIRHLAFYDSLTLLPNRRLLRDRLHQALAASARNQRQGALLFIDLDNFKILNDTLGHDIGDLLLKQVALRLTASVRESDTVARLGGDEFVVMLEDLSEQIHEAAAQAETVGEKILAVLNQPYWLAGHQHHSTPSIGVALFSDQHHSVDELLKRADLAMYQAKATGRNALCFFNPEMQATVTARTSLEADLREGLQQSHFLLHYQPQVDAANRLTGAEALIRWRHPQRGMVSPADFIPLAEDTGLILPLGHWVLETACHQLVQWAGLANMAHLTLAVNVSARQFRHPNFVEQVLAVLDRTGADPGKLKLELTESLLLDDVADAIAKMTALKDRGVGFSLDDFGTGYSSLAYLKRLPLDQLKIDQSFVRDILTDPNDAAIAKTIVALARSLGLAVIAEGVETEAQRDFLVLQNCHAFQGYLFGRPGPADALHPDCGKSPLAPL